MVEEMKAQKKTTDLESLLNNGPLERYGMQHLIETHPMIIKLLKKYGGDSYLRFTRIFFSFGILKFYSRSFPDAITRRDYRCTRCF